MREIVHRKSGSDVYPTKRLEMRELIQLSAALLSSRENI